MVDWLVVDKVVVERFRMSQAVMQRSMMTKGVVSHVIMEPVPMVSQTNSMVYPTMVPHSKMSHPMMT